MGFTKELSFSHDVEQYFAFIRFLFPSESSVSFRLQICGGFPVGSFPCVLACQTILGDFLIPHSKKSAKTIPTMLIPSSI